MVNQFTSSPKNLFLLDGFGALLSAFMLGIVLVQLESYFGMPKITLYWLAIAACGFAIYDFVCYFQAGEKWRSLLKGIAFINLTYSIISLVLLIIHFPKLTNLGVTYFVLELAILVFLIRLELKIATA